MKNKSRSIKKRPVIPIKIRVYIYYIYIYIYIHIFALLWIQRVATEEAYSGSQLTLITSCTTSYSKHLWWSRLCHSTDLLLLINFCIFVDKANNLVRVCRSIKISIMSQRKLSPIHLINGLLNRGYQLFKDFIKKISIS